MKKFIPILFVAFLAASSQAVGFSWNSLNPLTYNGGSLAYENSFSAYLIQISFGESATWHDYLSTATTVASLTADPYATSTTRMGNPPNMRGTIALVTGLGYNGNQGDVLGSIVIHNGWINFGTLFEINPSWADNQQGVQYMADFTDFINPIIYWGAGTAFATEALAIKSLTDPNGTGTPSGWYKFQQIPEPTTAGLALAGLALLFRRKRK